MSFVLDTLLEEAERAQRHRHELATAARKLAEERVRPLDIVGPQAQSLRAVIAGTAGPDEVDAVVRMVAQLQSRRREKLRALEAEVAELVDQSTPGEVFDAATELAESEQRTSDGRKRTALGKEAAAAANAELVLASLDEELAKLPAHRRTEKAARSQLAYRLGEDPETVRQRVYRARRHLARPRS